MNVPILIHTGIAISDVLDFAEPSFCEKHLKNSQPNVIHLYQYFFNYHSFQLHNQDKIKLSLELHNFLLKSEDPLETKVLQCL